MKRLCIKKLLPVLVVLALLFGITTATPLVAQAAGSTYYVDSVGGDDSNNGTSTTTAWKTLSKVNSVTFNPGDQILFKTGCSWTGMLNPKGSGAAGSPIVIDMYGTGSKPIINGNGVTVPSAAVKLANQSYWEIRNLEVTNNAATGGNRVGVLVRSDNKTVNNYIHLINLTVHNVKGDLTMSTGKSTGGIMVDSEASLGTKYNDLLIQGCTVYTCDRTGISVGWVDEPANKNSAYYNTNFVIRNNTLYDIGGDSIIVCHTSAPLVEYNVSQSGNTRAYNHYDSTAGYYDGYACAIWPWSTDNAVFQFNEAYGEKRNSDTQEDGTAFDVDSFNYASIHQYNYSHDNSGGFIMVCADGAPDSNGNPQVSQGSIIRYNISQNDDHDIFDLAGPSYDTYIYNNDIYTKSGMNIMPYNFRSTNGFNYNCYSYNNIFYNLGSGSNVWGTGKNIVFDYNVFYGNHASNEPSDAHKITTDPKLANPGSGGNGLNSVSGYKLQAGSPCIDSGMSIGSYYGKNNGGKDYWGNSLYNGAADRGVNEYTGTVSPANLITNPGFESALTGWNVDYGNNSVVTSNTHSGTNALRIGTAAGGRAQDATSGVSANKSYTLSAWCKVGTSGSNGYIGVDCLDSSGKVIKGSIVELNFTGTSYSQKSAAFTTPVGTVKLQVYITNDSGYVYADDLSLTAN